MTNKIPRGIRNCNPGNIRKTKDKWQGLRKEQTDPEFFQFTEMKYGYRALLKLLQNYRKKYKCNTIADFIARWAPIVENDTNKYTAWVCKEMGVDSTYVPDITSKEDMCSLAAAIAYVENGVKANMEEIYAGWDLLV